MNICFDRRRLLKTGAALLFTSVAVAAQAAGGAYHAITPEEAQKMMEKGGVVIVDVRSPEEFASGHVKGAHNVPLDTISAGTRIAPAPDFSKPLLVYCHSGRRATSAGEQLAATGYDVYNFQGVVQWPYGLVK